MFSNYLELQREVLAHLDLRTEARFDIPGLVTLAELRLRRLVTPPLLEDWARKLTSSEVISLPTRFRFARRVTVDGVRDPLRQLMPDDFHRLYSGEDGVGTPSAFTLIRNEMHLGPRPDGQITVELVYQRDEQLLEEKEEEQGNALVTNFYLDNMPDALLYGALVESGAYFNNPKIPLWQERFQQAVVAYNAEAVSAKFDGGPVRLRIRRGIR